MATVRGGECAVVASVARHFTATLGAMERTRFVPGSFSVFAAGFAIGASLIIAIGAQNAFVLRQGLRREHVLAVVAVCVLCDWALIAAGALGFGSLVRAFPLVTSLAAWGGALFLFVYGMLSFRSALHPQTLSAEETEVAARLTTTGAAVTATLAVSLLNPHVYLDTVVLLGSVAAQYAWRIPRLVHRRRMARIARVVLGAGVRRPAARSHVREADSLAGARRDDRRDHALDRDRARDRAGALVSDGLKAGGLAGAFDRVHVLVSGAQGCSDGVRRCRERRDPE